MNLEEKLNSTYYGVKTLSMKALDVDVASRKVKFYLATFDVKDMKGDVIRKGSFQKSLQEKGVDASGNRRIAHLRNHDWNQLVGKYVELYEDSKGLVGVSELGRSTKGNDTLLDYQDGLIREHSVGFKYIKGKISRERDSQIGVYNNIKELNLFEGSSVTFGMNELTPVIDIDVKSENYETILDKIQTLTETLNLAIKSGGTDERLENIELQFAQLQQLQFSLKGLKPSIIDTLDLEPNELEAQELKKKQLLINLINKSNGKI
jgi:HK97 family phage prohead protease